MNSVSSLLKPVQELFSGNFARMLLLLVIFAGLYSFVALDVSAPIQQPGASLASIDFFYLSTCPHCRQQVPTNEQLAVEFPQAEWIYHDMSQTYVQDLSAQMMEARNATPVKATPITIIGQRVFVGFYPDTQPAQMREAIRGLLNASNGDTNKSITNNSTPFSARALTIPFIGQLQPASMDPLTLSLSMGALDGFNPCAVWGVIALICMLMLADDWRKLGFLVGAFVLFSAIMHFIFVGGFASPYFVLGIMRYVMTAMGVFALFIGIYQIKAAWTKKERKKNTSFNALPEPESFGSLLENPVILALLAGLALMAVLFNALGSICSAAVPAIYNQAIASAGISGSAKLGYLAAYNVAYMLLDAVLLGAALLLMSGKLGEKVALATKIFCALLLTAFGLMLLFAPALLVGG
jgi:thiol-disulfide isomerase/thioredoxin